MKVKTVVYLVNGSTVSGGVEEATPEAIAVFKEGMTDLMNHENFVLNVESDNGSVGVIPGRQILWVELEVVG